MDPARCLVIERDLVYLLNRADDERQAVKACTEALASLFGASGLAISYCRPQNGPLIISHGKLATTAELALADETTSWQDDCRIYHYPLGDQVQDRGVLCLAVPSDCDFTPEKHCVAARCIGFLGVALSRIRSLSRMKATARDRDLLEREYRHRTRNTFQLLQNTFGFLLRQSKHGGQLILEDMESRLSAVIDLYERLDGAGVDNQLRLDRYFQELSALLRRLAVGSQTELVWASQALGSATMSIDRAATIGLILHELVINTLKHQGSAKIKITATLVSDGLDLDYDEGRTELADSSAEATLAYASPGNGLLLIDALLQRSGGHRKAANSFHFGLSPPFG